MTRPWRLAGRWNIGAEARFLTGTNLDLQGHANDADYFQLGVLMGWSWPADR